MTRAHVTLLGPCFKTGQMDSLPLHHRLSAQYSAPHATVDRAGSSHPQACFYTQHGNQTQTSRSNRHEFTHQQPPSPAHCTVPLRSADYTRKWRAQTSYLPSRAYKATRTIHTRFNHSRQTAAPVVVKTLRKCTGEQVRRTSEAHNT